MNINRLNDLYLVNDIITAYSYYVELELLKTSLKFNTTYEEYEKFNNLFSFIMKQEIPITDLIKDEDTKNNEVIDKYIELKNAYHYLKVNHNISKTKATKIFRKLNKTLLKLPQYYLSITHNCKYLMYYILNIITKEVFENNFIELSLLGNHKQMDKRLFYKLYTETLNILNNV